MKDRSANLSDNFSIVTDHTLSFAMMRGETSN